MMKGFLWIITMLWVPVLLGQSLINLKVQNLEELVDRDQFSLGFEYDKRNGKLKTRGEFYGKSSNLTRFKVKVTGAYFNEKNGNITLDRKLLRENGGLLIIDYQHPLEDEIRKSDTIYVPQVISLDIDRVDINYDQEFFPVVHFYFDDGSKRSYKSNRLMHFLKKNHLKLKIINGSLTENGSIKVGMFDGNLKNSYLMIKIDSFSTNREIKFDLGFKGHYIYDYSCLASRPSNDSLNYGERVEVFINELDDSLFIVKIKPEISKEVCLVVDPSAFKLRIISNGCVGEDGDQGCTGRDAPESVKDRELLSGDRGGPGEDGKRGGDGGDISIYYSPNFKHYLDNVSVDNYGGRGGSGGDGGNGGKDQMDPDQKPSFVDVLFPNRGPRGCSGKDGQSGQNGSLEFIVRP